MQTNPPITRIAQTVSGNYQNDAIQELEVIISHGGQHDISLFQQKIILDFIDSHKALEKVTIHFKSSAVEVRTVLTDRGTVETGPVVQPRLFRQPFEVARRCQRRKIKLEVKLSLPDCPADLPDSLVFASHFIRSPLCVQSCSAVSIHSYGKNLDMALINQVVRLPNLRSVHLDLFALATISVLKCSRRQAMSMSESGAFTGFGASPDCHIYLDVAVRHPLGMRNPQKPVHISRAFARALTRHPSIVSVTICNWPAQAQGSFASYLQQESAMEELTFYPVEFSAFSGVADAVQAKKKLRKISLLDPDLEDFEDDYTQEQYKRFESVAGKLLMDGGHLDSLEVYAHDTEQVRNAIAQGLQNNATPRRIRLQTFNLRNEQLMSLCKAMMDNWRDESSLQELELVIDHDYACAFPRVDPLAKIVGQGKAKFLKLEWEDTLPEGDDEDNEVLFDRNKLTSFFQLVTEALPRNKFTQSFELKLLLSSWTDAEVSSLWETLGTMVAAMPQQLTDFSLDVTHTDVSLSEDNHLDLYDHFLRGVRSNKYLESIEMSVDGITVPEAIKDALDIRCFCNKTTREFGEGSLAKDSLPIVMTLTMEKLEMTFASLTLPLEEKDLVKLEILNAFISNNPNVIHSLGGLEQDKALAVELELRQKEAAS